MKKKFYWIKLKTDFFNQDTIDFLLSQKNGCEYIVLYQMLCLNTANNDGELSTNIGEMIVPYDIDKIVRDTKYFDTDTVMVALELFKKLGLIYQEENNNLKITNFDELVGSETKWAKYKREKRIGKCPMNVQQEIEYRDKSIDIDKDNINTTNLYSYIETAFGRTLNPLEIEKIDSWLLLFSEDIIKHAIELSVMNSKRTFSYVDGIIKNWKGCNYTTLEEIKNSNKKKSGWDDDYWNE